MELRPAPDEGTDLAEAISQAYRAMSFTQTPPGRPKLGEWFELPAGEVQDATLRLLLCRRLIMNQPGTRMYCLTSRGVSDLRRRGVEKAFPPKWRQRDRAAAKQAGEWLARLSKIQVSVEELERFRTWRSNPVNDAAYSRLERKHSAVRR